MKKKNHEFSELLAMATAFHGHLCSGQIIGVRMAMLGLSELGRQTHEARIVKSSCSLWKSPAVLPTQL